MKCGTINCKCGQQFYFETMNNEIACIKCKKIYDVSSYPEKVEIEIIEPEIEGTESDGADI